MTLHVSIDVKTLVIAILNAYIPIAVNWTFSQKGSYDWESMTMHLSSKYSVKRNGKCNNHAPNSEGSALG